MLTAEKKLKNYESSFLKLISQNYNNFDMELYEIYFYLEGVLNILNEQDIKDLTKIFTKLKSNIKEIYLIFFLFVEFKKHNFEFYKIYINSMSFNKDNLYINLNIKNNFLELYSYSIAFNKINHKYNGKIPKNLEQIKTFSELILTD